MPTPTQAPEVAAASVAASLPTAPEEATRQLVVFLLGREQYALPIRQVQEIIRYTPPRSVSSSDPWIHGVISLRGKIIPVFDLALRLGLAADQGEDQKIVIVESRAGTAGVVVDEVEEVLTVEAEQVDGIPGSTNEAIEGIAKIDDRLVILLAPDGLFGHLAELEL